MNENGAASRLQRGWRWLGLAWLLLLLALGVQQWCMWSVQPRIDTDILALLPQDAHDRLLGDVTRRIADGSARQVAVLLGSADGAAAKRAQAAFAEAMATDTDGKLLVPSGSLEGWFDQARAFYAPYRDRLLTPAQREQLQQAEPGVLAEQALACADVAAVLAWLPRARSADLRRLHLAAARRGEGLLFALRPAEAAVSASPAPLRVQVDAEDGTPVPTLRLHLLKRRGPPLAEPVLLGRCAPLRDVLAASAAGQGVSDADRAPPWAARAGLDVVRPEVGDAVVRFAVAA